jgi:hypothetical protein
MGNSRAAEGLIRNQENCKRVTFQALKRKRTNASRLGDIAAARQALKDGKTIPWEHVKKGLKL